MRIAACVLLVLLMALLLSGCPRSAEPLPSFEIKPPEGVGPNSAALDSGDLAAEEPGAEAALLAALERKPGWAATIKEHSFDWTEVVVLIGPEADDWTTGLRFQWTEAGYKLVREGPVPVEEDTHPAGEEVPDLYQPGPEVAVEAALMDYPDWVAQIVDHSSDYRQVIVWVGPPASEWVAELQLEWNMEGQYYDMVSEHPLEYP